MIAPRRFSRFRVGAFAVIERIGVLLGGRRLYRWLYLRPERLVVREESIAVEGLPDALDGFTIVHLSDVHAGPFLGRGDLVSVAEVVERIAPDVVCWTGDFVVHGIESALPIHPELRRCIGRRATYAVFGNHDYLHRREGEFIEALEPAGWTFLRNASAHIDVDGASIAFAGIEDPEEGKVVDVDAAMDGASRADVVVALSHGPRAAPRFAQRGARLVLAGHTHGTQVDLPFLRDLGPPHPGLRVELGGTTLVVSRGLGAIGAPLRRGVPAEVVVLRLRSGTRDGEALSSHSCKAVSVSTPACSTSDATS